MAGRTIVTCTRCGATGHISIMHRVEKNNRGQRGAYICERCNSEMHGYTTKNNEQRGADTVHPFTYGMENETTYSNAKARSELYEYGMLPTADCTVDVEYKSAIENSLKSFSHLWKVMDRLIADGDMEIGSTAGSHFHVGHRDLNSETIEYIRRFYHSLFLPLSEAMKANDEATRNLFGRGIDEYNSEGDCWARSINEYTKATSHTNFINTQHSMTLEFRMAKFQNSKQYMRMAKFATKVTEIVMNNFVAHFNDSTFDTSRYNNITEYRKHKAQVAAKKIVAAFEKAINE